MITTKAVNYYSWTLKYNLENWEKIFIPVVGNEKAYKVGDMTAL